MDKYIIDKDITAAYVTASSFPDGIMAAHQQLHKIVPFTTARKYLGLSRPEGNGGIVYRAAAEVLSNEKIAQWQLDTYTISQGTYYSLTITNYMDDLPAIGRAFRQILARPDIDHDDGMCVEWYVSQKDVQCMVKVKTQDL